MDEALLLQCHMLTILIVGMQVMVEAVVSNPSASCIPHSGVHYARDLPNLIGTRSSTASHAARTWGREEGGREKGKGRERRRKGGEGRCVL